MFTDNMHKMNITAAGEAEFAAACDRMCGSRFIMSDMHIKNILKTIANSPRIYQIFASCIKNYDFRGIFSALKDAMDRGRFVMVYPDTEEEYLAFIFSLLFEIDSGKINFTKLLQSAYMGDSDNINRAYTNFCAEVIHKFKQIAMSVLRAGFIKSDYESAPPMTDAQAEEAMLAVSDFIIFLSKLSSLNFQVKDELYTIAQAMSDNLKADKKLVAALFFGLKYAAAPYNYMSPYIETLKKIFKAYGVIQA